MYSTTPGNSDVEKFDATQKLVELDEYNHHMFAFALVHSAACIASTLDIEVVMERILINVGRVVPNENTNIMLIDGDAACITYWKGFPDYYAEFFKETRFSLEIENLRTMLQTGAPIIINNTNIYPGWIHYSPQGKLVNSYIGVPIRAYEKIIGFLNLGSKQLDFFTTTHAEHLQAFADQVAIAITNAQMYGQIQQHASELERHIMDRTAEITIANERLQELDWLKSKFITDISHELRTPITNLNLRLYLLEHDKPEQQAEHMLALKNDINRLNELIEGITEFPHLEATKSTLVFDRVDLNQIVSEVAANYSQTAFETGLYLTFEPDPNMPVICGNPNTLRRVVTSLVTNALSYTSNGGVHLSTEVCPSSNRLCLTIQDTGIGIDPEDMPHLFERFYRGKHVGSSNIPGAGLGLSFVKEILELHYGEIEIESKEGTTVKIWLPLADTSICRTSKCTKKCWIQVEPE